MSDNKLIPGKFVWFEHLSRDAKKAQAFYGEVLGWKVAPYSMGTSTYEMIMNGDAMIGGYPPPSDGGPARWIAYASVEDVDAAVQAATAAGGRVVAAPRDIPDVGRSARVADPQGAELAMLKSSSGDAPDVPMVPNGSFLWHELHTPDPAKALGFYQKVFGFTWRAEKFANGTYHIISSKGGVDRGGASDMLPPGTPPHWLPYVCVADVDGTLARARKQGGQVHVDAFDIPGVGRIGVLVDPTGAALALMKPSPAMPKK